MVSTTAGILLRQLLPGRAWILRWTVLAWIHILVSLWLKPAFAILAAFAIVFFDQTSFCTLAALICKLTGPRLSSGAQIVHVCVPPPQRHLIIIIWIIGWSTRSKIFSRPVMVFTVLVFLIMLVIPRNCHLPSYLSVSNGYLEDFNLLQTITHPPFWQSQSSVALWVKSMQFLWSAVKTNINKMAAQRSANVFVCEFKGCKKQFSKERRLIEHKRMHTGEVNDIFLVY